MRAVYDEELFVQKKDYVLTKEKSHHLINVVRVKAGEQIIALNGKGQISTLVVKEIQKKEVIVKCENIQIIGQTGLEIDVMVCKVKKDAMDLVFKSAVELGIKKIIVVDSDFSQRYELNRQRVDKLINSALEQSNNPFKLQIVEDSLKNFKLESYDSVISFSSKPNDKNESLALEKQNKKILIIIGPEGGFSDEEELSLEKTCTHKIFLDTPIMRTQTALGCAVGYILGSRAFQ